MVSDAAKSRVMSTTEYAVNKYVLLSLIVLYYSPKQHQY